jgi:hypothetical protein
LGAGRFLVGKVVSEKSDQKNAGIGKLPQEIAKEWGPEITADPYNTNPGVPREDCKEREGGGERRGFVTADFAEPRRFGRRPFLVGKVVSEK